MELQGSYCGDDIDVGMMCFCGEIAPLCTSKSITNPGRRFFGCPNYMNLSQLASINYDFVVRSAQESPDASKQSMPDEITHTVKVPMQMALVLEMEDSHFIAMGNKKF